MKNIEIFCKEKGIIYRKNEPLAEYTTLRIGGLADLLIFLEEDIIQELMEVIKKRRISLLYYRRR